MLLRYVNEALIQLPGLLKNSTQDEVLLGEISGNSVSGCSTPYKGRD